MTVAPNAAAEHSFPLVQQRHPGGHAAVASGLVEWGPPVQRSGGEQESSTAVASGIVERRLQRRGSGGAEASDSRAVSGLVDPARAVHAAAAHGVATPTSTLPHLAMIQRSFGHHDVSGIHAHTGGEARASADAMGADAYATGNHVVFGRNADLFTAAHEAAHVVQQRGGVQLKGGVGESGDVYERHADAVASMVVQGKSAESLLDQLSGRGGAAATDASDVQRMDSRGSLGADQRLQRAGSHLPAPSGSALAPGGAEHLPTKAVSSRAYSRLQIAARAIAAAKAVIPHAGNQKAGLRETRMNSYYRMLATRDERSWEYVTEEARQLAQAYPEADEAAKAELARGGNCGELSWVAYHYLRLHARGEHLQQANSKDHDFMVIGDMKTEPDSDLVVCDPWPNNPTACLWEDHFAYTPDRAKVAVQDHMIADGKSFKAAIAAGLRLSKHGQRQVERAQLKRATEEAITRGEEVGLAGEKWIKDVNDTTADGKKFAYTERDERARDHGPDPGANDDDAPGHRAALGACLEWLWKLGRGPVAQ